MTKKQAINIITKCAKMYNLYLCNKQLMFVYHDENNQVHKTEVVFRPQNYMHLTGISPREGLSPKDFYRFSLSGHLALTDFTFKSNFTTELKLNILETIMKIAYSARMIGEYIGPHINLYTEKVTGTTNACLGLILAQNIYVPNSTINEDIRNIAQKPLGKIFVIFRKEIQSNLYTEITYRSKNIDITTQSLPQNIQALVSPELFCQ